MATIEEQIAKKPFKKKSYRSYLALDETLESIAPPDQPIVNRPIDKTEQAALTSSSDRTEDAYQTQAPVISAVPAPSTVSAETAVPVEPTAPVAVTVPAQSTAPVESSVPAEIAAPAILAVPVETSVPVESTVPAETAVSVEMTVPVESTVPHESTVPVESAVPVEKAGTAKSTVPKAKTSKVARPSPHTGPGWTSINHRIIETLYLADLKQREYRILAFVLRETICWHRAEVQLSTKEFQDKLGLDDAAIWRTLPGLVENGYLLKRAGESNQGNFYGLNPAKFGRLFAPAKSTDPVDATGTARLAGGGPADLTVGSTCQTDSTPPYIKEPSKEPFKKTLSDEQRAREWVMDQKTDRMGKPLMNPFGLWKTDPKGCIAWWQENRGKDERRRRNEAEAQAKRDEDARLEAEWDAKSEEERAAAKAAISEMLSGFRGKGMT